jgi:hypothetical protein
MMPHSFVWQFSRISFQLFGLALALSGSRGFFLAAAIEQLSIDPLAE